LAGCRRQFGRPKGSKRMLTRNSFKVRSGWKGRFWRKAAVYRSELYGSACAFLRPALVNVARFENSSPREAWSQSRDRLSGLLRHTGAQAMRFTFPLSRTCG
jgi:hypothetical protein